MADNPLRLSGISSGLDIEGFVSRLMQVEKRPVLRLTEKQGRLDARLKAWNEIRSKLIALQAKLSDLGNASNFGGFKATVADTSLMTASVTGSPEPKSYSVGVLQLARNTTYEGMPAPADVVSDPDAALAGVVDSEFNIRNADGSLRNGAPIQVAAGSSLNQVAAAIEGAGINLKATVLQVNPGDYRLVVQDNRTGASTHFTFEPVAGNVLDYTGLTAPTALLQQADNARISVDGVEISRETNVFSDVIAGVNLTALKVGGTTSLTIAKDTDKAYGAIKGFVDAYNALVDTVNKYTNYDEKTKTAAVLFGDAGVGSLVANLRVKLSATVSGVADAANSLAVIGVGTGKFGTADFSAGKLVIDSKLTTVLGSNLADVQELFTRAGDGLAVTTRALVDGYVGANGVVTAVTGSIQSQIQRLQERIKYYNEVLLPQKEGRLRQQFVRLDRVMGTFQAQAQWMTAQLTAMRGEK